MEHKTLIHSHIKQTLLPTSPFVCSADLKPQRNNGISLFFYQQIHSSISRCIKINSISVVVAGERSKDEENILQKQGVQEAHLTQSYPIQKG